MGFFHANFVKERDLIRNPLRGRQSPLVADGKVLLPVPCFRIAAALHLAVS